MSDFIREVDEEYRRDRAMALLTRYQVPIAILVVAIIAAAGGWRFWSDRQVSAAEALNARYLAAADLAKDGKGAEAQAAFEALAKEAPAGYTLIARMRAAELQSAKDAEGAAKAFDAIAADETLAASMRDAARLRGAMLRVDREEPKAFEARYGRFGQAAASFRSSYRELLALAAMKRGDLDAAGRYLDEIIIDPVAPVGLRGRAQAFRQLVLAGPAKPMDKQPSPASVTQVTQNGGGAKGEKKSEPGPQAPTSNPPAANPANPPPPNAPKP